MATVLIIGATSDMGRAIARTFASKGYDLQLAARRMDDLKTLRSDLKIRYNIRCSLHSFDALKIDSHLLFWNSLPSIPDISIVVFGHMDDNQVAINNQDALLNTIHVNYTGAVSILNIISRTYKQQERGQIAGISSVAGERGRGSNFIYGSAKAGFTAYLSGLRNEMFPYGVHVTTILPGFVYTKMTENIKLPAPLTATPGEVAETIYTAIQKKKNVVYVKWFWKWIMFIIRNIPEGIFKKLKW
ncbi:MAG: SDR family oxidoreductase [Sphingobacteriales bacterium]|jgi:decaprenylphospho-beta-D-erythro-pentofuranosid-2-ulose 2-reductase